MLLLLLERLEVFLAEVLHFGGLVDEVDGALLVVVRVVQIRFGFQGDATHSGVGRSGILLGIVTAELVDLERVGGG